MSKIPRGISFPSAQLGKSWSNACSAAVPYSRPLRYRRPRNSFALVSTEKPDCPLARTAGSIRRFVQTAAGNPASTPSDIFPHLATPQADVSIPRLDRVAVDRNSLSGSFLSRLSWSLTGEHRIGVAGGLQIKRVDQGAFELAIGINLFFRPPPGRRTRPTAGSSGSCSISWTPRSIVLRETPSSSEM